MSRDKQHSDYMRQRAEAGRYNDRLEKLAESLLVSFKEQISNEYGSLEGYIGYMVDEGDEEHVIAYLKDDLHDFLCGADREGCEVSEVEYLVWEFFEAENNLCAIVKSVREVAA